MEEVKLQGVGGVQKNDDLVKVLFRQLEHFLFFFAECEVVFIRFLRVCDGVRVAVVAFTAYAGKGDDRRVAVACERVDHALRIFVLGNFSDGSVSCKYGALAFRRRTSVRFPVAVKVEIPKGGVDGVFAKRGFQRIFQIFSSGSVHVARARTAVHEVDGAGGKGAHFRAGCKGQCAVIFKQSRAFRLYVVADFFTGIYQRFRAFEIALEIGSFFVCVHEFVETAADECRDRVVKHIQEGGNAGQNEGKHRGKNTEEFPTAYVLASCPFVGIFRSLVV